MKNNLHYSILLAVTVAVTGFMVFHNVVLRESFPVAVRYEVPAVQANAPAERAPQSAAPGPASRVESGSAASRAQAAAADEGEKAAGDLWAEVPAADEEAERAAVYDEFYEEPDEGEVVVRFPLDLNRAVYEELVLIPRIGDVTAQRILQYRDVLGGYEELEQLMEIKGIGEKTYDAIEPYLYVGEN